MWKSCCSHCFSNQLKVFFGAFHQIIDQSTLSFTLSEMRGLNLLGKKHLRFTENNSLRWQRWEKKNEISFCYWRQTNLEVLISWKPFTVGSWSDPAAGCSTHRLIGQHNLRHTAVLCFLNDQFGVTWLCKNLLLNTKWVNTLWVNKSLVWPSFCAKGKKKKYLCVFDDKCLKKHAHWKTGMYVIIYTWLLTLAFGTDWLRSSWFSATDCLSFFIIVFILTICCFVF